MGDEKRGNFLELDLLASAVLDIEDILDDLRIEWMDNKGFNFNTTAFNRFKHLGDNLMCNCPFHQESNPSFGILTIYPYTWQCFSCDTSGNLLQLIEHVLDLPSVVHAEQYLLKNYIELDVEKRAQIDMDSLLDPYTDKRVSMLESELDKYKGKRHNYMYKRGFTEHTLSKYEVGYDEVTRDMVMPIRTSEGNIRFLKRRSVDKKRFDNAEGINKKDILFGLYYLKKSMGRVKEVYLTESETDTMACYQEGLPAASIMGRILFKEQIMELLRAGVEVVNLFYDNDMRGQEAIEKSYQLLKNVPMRINVVKYPYHLGIDTLDEEDINGKDANNLLKLKQFEEIKLLSYEEYQMLKCRR